MADDAAIAALLRWRRDAVAFVREALGAEPEPWQERALRAVALHDRIAIRSGHGPGKSTLLSWIILWFIGTRFPSKIPCTAPTSHQLEDVLWGELARWHRKLPEPLRQRILLSGKQLALAEAPKEAFAVARTARKEEPEAFQGFHSDHLLFVVDEASGVEDIIFEVGEGAMTTPGAKTVLAGNPTRTSGYFFDAFHRHRAHWHPIHVDCTDPKAVTNPARRAALDAYAAQMAQKYGAASNIYRVRVLGEFPESEDDVVIPLSWCESAVGREIEPVRGFRTVWGLDVARFGGDRTALAKRRANVLLEPLKVWQGLDLMQVCGRVLDEFEQLADAEEMRLADPSFESELPAEILVDAIGIGAGVVDRLRELGLPAVGINVGETPAAGERFMRLRDELWWKAREWFEARECRLGQGDGEPQPYDGLIGELSAPKYAFTSAGKIKVESKDDMKKRGLQSPDLADAFCLTFAGGVQRVERHISSRYQAGRRRKPRGTWMSA